MSEEKSLMIFLFLKGIFRKFYEASSRLDL